MSPPGRPKGELHRSAQREGIPMSPPGRPKANYTGARSAKAFQ
jgi:16S rRNA (guanine527-N7)-methyltransferase